MMDELKIGDYVSLTFSETRMIITRVTVEGDLVCKWNTREPYLSHSLLPGGADRYLKSRSGVFRKDMLIKIG
jgi:uncharacterized protein YodC (DUF2158 family)